MTLRRSPYQSLTPGRFSLVEGLGTAASLAPSETRVIARREDQLTVLLAWLCDRSDTFAREFVRLFLRASDTRAMAALEKSRAFAASVQVHLPRLPGTGLLRPDLSIEAVDRVFHLLVEVKFGAPFEKVRVGRTSVLQPDAYVRAWKQCERCTEASVRRVGSLRLDLRAMPQARSALRARDVTWREVRRLLSALEDHQLGGVQAAARDLERFLDNYVTEANINPADVEHGTRLVEAIGERLAAQFPSAHPSRLSQARPPKNAAGRWVYDAELGGEPVNVWIGYTPARTPYNVPGWPDVIQIQIPSASFTPELRERGFSYEHDLERKRWVRARLLEPATTRPFTEQVEFAIEAALRLLRRFPR